MRACYSWGKGSIQHENSLAGFRSVNFTSEGFRLYSLTHHFETSPCGVLVWWQTGVSEIGQEDEECMSPLKILCV